MTTKNANPANKTGVKKLDETLGRISERIAKKSAEKRRELEEQGFDEEAIAAVNNEHQDMVGEISESIVESDRRIAARPVSKRVSSPRLIERAQLALFEGEQRGDFTSYPISPGSECPSIMLRGPFFSPNKRSTALKKAKLDNDLARHFESGWCEGRIFGPVLTEYDRDTIIALLHFRQVQLVGKGSRMPVQVMDPNDPRNEGDTAVQVVTTTIGEIEEFWGNAKGGRGYKRRLDSVKRIAGSNVEFTKISDKKDEPIIKARSFTTKFIDLMTEELTTDSCIYIQFPPVMVKWLEGAFTWLDVEIRRELKGDNAKAIHAFLSSQDTFNIGCEKLRTEITDSALPMNKFMVALRDAMKQLESLGWCQYEISGTGRKTPFILKGHKLKKRDR
jgi:hypothetical protein